MASIGLRLVRAAFSASERVAPNLAGRAAFELFCRTPSPRRQTPGERRAVVRAADFMMTARHHRLTTGAGCVAVHEFRPEGREPRGNVLVIHGWRSRTEFMRALIQGLTGEGYRVMSLDLPGHGASSGRRLDVKTAVQATKAAADWFGPVFAIVGHSFGGAVAINAAAGSVEGLAALPAARLVTIASPSVLGDIFERFGEVVGLGARSQAAMNSQVLRVAGRPLSAYQSGELLMRMPIETLVVHAHDDREVSPRHAELVAKAGPHVRLEWREGLGHRRIISDAGVVNSVVDFLSAPLAGRLAA